VATQEECLAIRARPEQEAEKGCQVLSPLFRSIDVKPVYD